MGKREDSYWAGLSELKEYKFRDMSALDGPLSGGLDSVVPPAITVIIQTEHDSIPTFWQRIRSRIQEILTKGEDHGR